jgi:hypothetical protein
LVAACASSGSSGGDDPSSSLGTGATGGGATGGSTAAGGGGAGPTGGKAGATAGQGGNGNADAGTFPDGGQGTGGTGGKSAGGASGASAGTAGSGGATGGGSGTAGTAGAAGSGGTGSGGAGSGGGPPVCKDMWSASVPGVALSRAAMDPGASLYAVGTKGALGWVGAIDPCSGAVTASASAGLPGSALNGLRVANGQVYTAGSYGTSMGTTDGLFQPFATGTLAAGTTVPLFGTTGDDSLADVVPTSSTTLWLGGVSNQTPGSPVVFGVRMTTLTDGCGFPGGAGEVKALGLSGGSLLALVQTGTSGAVYAIDASGGCNPSILASTPLAIGAASTTVEDMFVQGTTAFVVGNADDGSGPIGFLAAVDTTAKTVSGVYHDVVPSRRYRAIAASSTLLFIGGSQGTTGYVGAWSKSLVPAWAAGAALPMGTDDVRGVAADGDSVFVSAKNGGIAKCVAATGACVM